MTDSSSTTTSILNKSHPSSLLRNTQALSILSGDVGGNATSKKKSTTAGLTARQMLPLVACRPPPSSDSATCAATEEKPFLQTPFNLIDDGETYESPWTHQCYTGSGDDCQKTTKTAESSSSSSSSSKLSPASQSDVQGFQDAVNEVWDAYRQLYYGHDAVASVFIQPTRTSTDASLALEAVFAVSKQVQDGSTAQWQSIHVVQISPPDLGSADKTCDYAIDSAVWCDLHPAVAAKGQKYYSDTAARIDLSSLLQRSTSKTCPLLKSEAKAKLQIPLASHVENIGTLLEQIEADIRSHVERVSMPKTTEVATCMWREPGRSATVHLVTAAEMAADDETNPFGYATGMGVGKGLIGEIATKAKSKGLGDHDENGGKRNSVAEHMASKQREKRESLKENTKTANEYSDMRKGLKSSGGGVQTLSSTAPTSSTTSSSSPSTVAAAIPTSPVPRSPVPAGGVSKKAAVNPYGDIRSSLKKNNISSPSYVPKSPVPMVKGATPEFVDFRSKLKSPVKTTSK
jgi:F-actin capping protein, beta subunit